MEKYKFIGVPFRSGCNREGAQLAPGILCELLLLPNEQLRFLHFASEIEPLSDEMQNGVKNYNNVLDMSYQLRDVVSREVNDQSTVVVIGGDHSLGLGSVAGSLQYDNNVGLIWFDAHTDINTEATSPSGNAHGMPIAALMGLCSSSLNDVATIRINPQNVFWIGARDVDSGEVAILKKIGIDESNVFSTEYVHEKGMQSVVETIRKKMMIQNIKNVHLSFDVDGMDPSIVAATGTKVASGILQEELDMFIDRLNTLPRICTFDFVEYNPLLDNEDYTTGKWCVNTFRKILKSME